jgi:hypothetical protein
MDSDGRGERSNLCKFFGRSTIIGKRRETSKNVFLELMPIKVNFFNLMGFEIIDLVSI